MEITLQIVQQNGWDHVFYMGPINEESEVHLSPLLKTLGTNCVFHFKQVANVNSCGVRAWINFMREVEKNRQIVFEECTPEIVMQMNMIPSFKGKAAVKSVFGSYGCESCGTHKWVLFEAGRNLPTEEGAELPPVKCEKCGQDMEMEEMEDEFFSFARAS